MKQRSGGSSPAETEDSAPLERLPGDRVRTKNMRPGPPISATDRRERVLCCEQKGTTDVARPIYDPGMGKLRVVVDPEASTSRDQVAPAPQPREPLWRDVLGERLRGLRHERGATLDDVATRAGVSPQYLSEMERGLKEPSSEMIAAVAGALDVTLGDLTLEIAERLSPVRTARAAQVSAGQVALALAA
jgi:DNA-binding XRE family transcriptional regulator